MSDKQESIEAAVLWLLRTAAQSRNPTTKAEAEWHAKQVTDPWQDWGDDL